jgi:hypothetical protein
MKLTLEQCKQRRQIVEEMVRTGASDSQFSVLYRRELDALDTIDALTAESASILQRATSCGDARRELELQVKRLTAERDVASGQALREADKLSEAFGLELLSKGDKHGWSICDDFGHRLRALDPSAVKTAEEHDKQIHHQGVVWMLEEIICSLRGYPDHGGDIQVMTEVERIAAEARRDALAAMLSVQSVVEFYLKREINSPSNHQEFAREAQDKLGRFHAAMGALAALPASGQAEGKQP